MLKAIGSYSKVPSVFELAGTSKLSKEEAFKLLDKMRAED